MLKVFISYSRKNQNAVEVLAKDIEELGHSVWIDQRLKGGQEWWNEILHRIRDCDLFVFALSQEIEKSKACGLELGYAHDLGKIILPVLITENVSMNLFPDTVSTKQYVDYRVPDKSSTIKLSNALNSLPSPPPLPQPLPEPREVPLSYLDKLKDEIKTTKTLSFEEQTAIIIKFFLPYK